MITLAAFGLAPESLSAPGRFLLDGPVEKSEFVTEPPLS